MPLILSCAALFIQVGAQEPVVQLILTTKDGHKIVGLPVATSMKIESSLGAVDVSFKELHKIKFEGETVSATSRDGTLLKGKLQQKTLKVTSLLGELEFKTDGLKEAQTQFVPAAQPFGYRKEGQVILLVRTKDGNDVVGSTDLAKISFDSSVAKFEIDIKHVSSLARAMEPNILALLDGSEIRGTAKLGSVKVQSKLGEFTIKPEDISVIQYRETRPVPKGPGDSPPQGPKKGAEAGGPNSPAIEPLRKAEIKAVLGTLLVSKDGKKLYAMNLSEGRVCRWKLPDLEEDGSTAVKGGEKALSLDPSGNRVFAGGQNTISIFGTDPLTLQKSFAVETPVEDVVAVDQDLLVTTGLQGTALVSISKTAVVDRQRNGASTLSVTPKGDRIYAGDAIIKIEREAGGKSRLLWQVPNFGMTTSAFGMVISPDGRYGCTFPDARVLRLGRCWTASRVQLAQLENNSVGAFAKDNGRLFFFTEQGFLKVYETGEFALQTSHYLGIRATFAVLDSDGASVIVAGWPVNEVVGRSGFVQGGRAATPLNLYRYALPK